MDENINHYIVVGAMIIFLVLIMSQCVSNLEKYSSNERIEIEKIEAQKNRPIYVGAQWDWYDGCLKGCQIAGQKVLTSGGVGINNYLIHKCSDYCVQEMRS
jgi:hypothetical protein